jgi:hypothetical protein
MSPPITTKSQQLVVYKKQTSTADKSQKGLHEASNSQFFSTYHFSEAALNAIQQQELMSSIKAALND